ARSVSRLSLVLGLVLLEILPRTLDAQDVSARLGGRVPPTVRQAVVTIAAGAAARGLPVEPLVQKAIEGGAKGVPADRVIAGGGCRGSSPSCRRLAARAYLRLRAPWAIESAQAPSEPTQTLSPAPIGAGALHPTGGVGRFPVPMPIAHNLGFPPLGVARELKRATEGYWGGKVSLQDLLKTGAELRARHWRLQQEAGIDLIPSNDFSYYDRMLDTCALVLSRDRKSTRRTPVTWPSRMPSSA